MKTLLLLAVSVMALFSIAGPASGAVLTFEGLSTEGIYNSALVPQGYGGLDWSKICVMNSTEADLSGFTNGVVSADNVAFNSFGRPAEISSTTPFNFEGVYLTGLWNNNLKIDVTGYRGTQKVYASTVVVDVYTPRWFEFDYLEIDRLVFKSYGGAPAYGGRGNNFVMDDFTFSRTLPTPEPSTFVLLGLGLAGIAVLKKRKR